MEKQTLENLGLGEKEGGRGAAALERKDMAFLVIDMAAISAIYDIASSRFLISFFESFCVRFCFCDRFWREEV